jgi:plasmid maintenance system antidote protein VapI
MINIETIQKLLKDRKKTVIAKAVGLHYNTVLAIANGKKTVEYESIRKLSDYFTEEMNAKR